jgi:eukaryotic-like serine/threonine-protein kinase
MSHDGACARYPARSLRDRRADWCGRHGRGLSRDRHEPETSLAIKVLPDALAADAERLARLQREAEVLASLNHPHIAQIYGLEKSENSTALVLELVDGPTLADRIVEGPIPIEEALPIAKQIAEALEAAHEQGIVHRDLKPANIKLRPDGQVKVLDFGLAKMLARTPPECPNFM